MHAVVVTIPRTLIENKIASLRFLLSWSSARVMVDGDGTERASGGGDEVGADGARGGNIAAAVKTARIDETWLA